MERPGNVARQFVGLIPASGVLTSVRSALVLLALMVWLAFPAPIDAQQRTDLPSSFSSPQFRAPAIDAKQLADYQRAGHTFPTDRRGGGIQEAIPEKYNDRYQKWKKEFLASESSRGQWDAYAHHRRLVLTITISADLRNGARTGNYEWDDSGSLIAATIALGPEIDEGYPNPVYYPVLSSLKRLKPKLTVWHILAAAKIAHEFDHVNQASAGGPRYLLQTEIAHAYNAILLSNGHNTRDSRLIELARELGRTPVELREEREYLAEEKTMRYLLDRITNGATRRMLLNSVKQTIGRYATNFGIRFTLMNGPGEMTCRLKTCE
jgi:hypothetical protein